MRLLEKSKRLVISIVFFVVSVLVMFFLVSTFDSAKTKILEKANLERSLTGGFYYDLDNNHKEYTSKDDYVSEKLLPRYGLCALDGILILVFGVKTVMEYVKVSSFISEQAKLEEQKEKKEKLVNNDDKEDIDDV